MKVEVCGYTDRPHEALFVARHLADCRHLLTERDLQNPLLLEAPDYLRAAGKTDLNWLDGERSKYRPIAPAAS